MCSGASSHPVLDCTCAALGCAGLSGSAAACGVAAGGEVVGWTHDGNLGLKPCGGADGPKPV